MDFQAPVGNVAVNAFFVLMAEPHRVSFCQLRKAGKAQQHLVTVHGVAVCPVETEQADALRAHDVRSLQKAQKLLFFLIERVVNIGFSGRGAEREHADVRAVKDVFDLPCLGRGQVRHIFAVDPAHFQKPDAVFLHRADLPFKGGVCLIRKSA